MAARVAAWLLVAAALSARPIDRARTTGARQGPGPAAGRPHQLDRKTNVVTAEGNVDVVQGGRHLFADVLHYDQNANTIDAEGNVTLLEPNGDALYADRLELSDDFKNGVAQQLRARLNDNELFAAASGDRTGGTVTEMEKASTRPARYAPIPTPPRCGRSPRSVSSTTRWSTRSPFTTPSSSSTGCRSPIRPICRNRTRPSSASPASWPPSFGTNSQLGQFIQTPYYFALAPNYDVTLAPIFLTQEPPVLTAEYRHLLPSGHFNLSGSGTYATEAGSDSDPSPTGDAFRGHLKGAGSFNLTDDARWGYDLAVTTDDTYLQRYKFSNDNVLTNRLFTEKVWDRNYAALNGYAFQGLRHDRSSGGHPGRPAAGRDRVEEPALALGLPVHARQQPARADPDRRPQYPASVDDRRLGGALDERARRPIPAERSACGATPTTPTAIRRPSAARAAVTPRAACCRG